MSVPGDIMQKGRRIVSIALLVLLWVAYSLSGLLKIYAISEFISPVLVFSVSVCLLFAARKKHGSDTVGFWPPLELPSGV